MVVLPDGAAWVGPAAGVATAVGVIGRVAPAVGVIGRVVTMVGVIGRVAVGNVAVSVAVAATRVGVWVGAAVGLADVVVAVAAAGRTVGEPMRNVRVGRTVEMGRGAVAVTEAGGVQAVGAALPRPPPDASGITNPAARANPTTTMVSTTIEDR